MVTPEVTAVYTWVDSQCPSFQDALQHFAQSPSDRNPERYRDDWDLLRYSLRSLHQHCPWITKVCLFTARPQVPRWLQRDRVQVVHHDEVIEERYLPTFSTRTIESFLHKIPFQTPWFLVMQDDWLFTRDVRPQAFWDEQGRVKVYGTYLGESAARLSQDKPNLPGQHYLEHVPRMAKAEWWEKMTDWLPEELERTRGQRFRKPGGLRMDRLYRNFLLQEMKNQVKAVPFFQNLRVHSFVMLLNDLTKLQKALKRVKKKRPLFLCLNDDLGPAPSEEVNGAISDFLQELFPSPSPYEIGSESL